MNCFNHQDISAISSCKCCNKGLCKECAVDLGHGLSCKGEHEGRVKSMNMIIEKNAKVYASASKNSIIAPIFYLFMGLLFAGFGFYSKAGITGLPFVMGVGFIAFGVIIYLRNKALFGNEKT